VKQKFSKIMKMMLVSMASIMAFGCGSSSDVVTTTPQPSASVTVSTKAATIVPGDNVEFTATFNSTDGTQTDVSKTATFRSLDTTVGTFPTGTGQNIFSALQVGGARVVADYQGFEGALDIQVTGTPVATAVFVNGTSGSDATGDGTTTLPFQTITKASADAPEGTTINVAAGTYAESVTLKNGQTLVGGSFVAQATAGTRPVITGRVTMNNGNTVKGFEFASAANPAIQTTGGVSGTIEECILRARSADVPEIALGSASGTWNVKTNTINHNTGVFDSVSAQAVASSKLSLKVQNNEFIGDNTVNVNGIDLFGAGEIVADVTTNTFTNYGATATAIEVFASATTSNFCFNIRGNTGSGIIRLDNTAGSTTFEVEQATSNATLQAVNTGLTVAAFLGTINNAADGACAARF
jgi:hypothetical protein